MELCSGFQSQYTKAPILQLLRHNVLMSSTVCTFVVEGRGLMFHEFKPGLVQSRTDSTLALLVPWPLHNVSRAPLGKWTEGAADLSLVLDLWGHYEGSTFFLEYWLVLVYLWNSVSLLLSWYFLLFFSTHPFGFVIFQSTDLLCNIW